MLFRERPALDSALRAVGITPMLALIRVSLLRRSSLVGLLQLTADSSEIFYIFVERMGLTHTGAALFCRKDDIILRVNITDTVNVDHNIAVDALKRAGNVVRLVRTGSS